MNGRAPHSWRCTKSSRASTARTAKVRMKPDSNQSRRPPSSSTICSAEAGDHRADAEPVGLAQAFAVAVAGRIDQATAASRAIPGNSCRRKIQRQE